MSVPVEGQRDRFDVPSAWRKEQEKRLRATLTPILYKVLPPPLAREWLDATVPYLQDEAARIAQLWLRQHQLGEKAVAWVDMEEGVRTSRTHTE